MLMMQGIYFRVVHGSFIWAQPDPPQITPKTNENIDPDLISGLSKILSHHLMSPNGARGRRQHSGMCPPNLGRFAPTVYETEFF